jgi:hypothetical protein
VKARAGQSTDGSRRHRLAFLVHDLRESVLHRYVVPAVMIALTREDDALGGRVIVEHPALKPLFDHSPLEFVQRLG